MQDVLDTVAAGAVAVSSLGKLLTWIERYRWGLAILGFDACLLGHSAFHIGVPDVS